MQQLRQVMLDLEDFELENVNLNIPTNEFLDLLINNIKNEVISYQAKIFKTLNESYEQLIKKLNELKIDVSANFVQISELELKLHDINEAKINALLEINKNFLNLNSERITPFL
jgi:hypothetical protein